PGDADGEGHPGAQPRLVEQHRGRPRAGQGAAEGCGGVVPRGGSRAESVLLHLRGQVEDRALLGRGQVVVAQEVPGHLLTSSRIRGRAAVNSSASEADSISGGASRMASGCTALTRNPARRAAASTSGATSAVSTTARHSPAPRTPASSGWLIWARPAARCSPTDVTWASSPSRSMVSSTARAAAQATGLPPKVEPWSPLAKPAPAAPSPTHIPIGSPPPRPLASVSTSGRTPAAWC